MIADLIRAHPGTISLGQGVVGYGPPAQAAAAIGRFLADPLNHRYQAVGGIPPLIEALTRWMATEHGVRVGAEHVNRLMVTAGGNNAFLAAVLAIADPGDEVILPAPYYFNHEMAVTMADCRPVPVPTDSAHQLDLATIRAAITPRTRAIVTVSPNNPTGAVYPAATLRAVNALCAERGIYHLSDEAYAPFTWDGTEHFSPASLPGAAGHTISLHSMSKAFGFASWRIGWLVFPAPLESALRKVQDTLVICPPVVSQFAALGALEAGGDWVRGKVAGIADNRRILRDALRPLGEEGRVTAPPADGAFYFLVRARSTRPALELAERLVREHGVAVVPGSAFGDAVGCSLRVAYGALTPDTAAEGVGRLVRGLRALVG
ncbi:MAG: pyridoxal phosphate-dependent aminotransferase [Opitutaceae bacterium]|nr:pyridoxal phosphate-dependent aminotransferase [Opitutaceae bacterium]